MRFQITRTAVSVPANIAEGWTRETAKDKANFLAIAQGPLAETETLVEDTHWFTRTDRFAVSELGETGRESELVEAPPIKGK